MRIIQWLKSRKPWVFENSRVPVWVSKISPIEIWALSFGFWVWCRGELSDKTRRHETIHYQQQIELFFVGQWLLYGIFWLVGLIRYRDRKEAYYENPFEREAYAHDEEPNYLKERPWYNWRHYVRK